MTTNAPVRIEDLPPGGLVDGSEMLEATQGGRSVRLYTSQLFSAGDSAYQVAVKNGYEGTAAAWLASLIGPKGDQGFKGDQGLKGDTGDRGMQGVQGYSAYEVAVQDGYVGTITAWLASLKGTNGTNGADGQTGPQGKSAYQVAVDGGYVGTQAQWLASLVGAQGKSAYQVAVDGGYVGTQAQWLASLVGAQGKSAYQVAVDGGYVGTQAQWLASLKGADGVNGKSAYQLAVDGGYVGTQTQWLASLVGAKGDIGNTGATGKSAYELALQQGYVGDLNSWLASLVGPQGPAVTQLPYDITFSMFEQMASDVTVGGTKLSRPVTLAAGLGTSQAYCDIPPASSPARFDISVDNVVVGSVTFNPGTNLGVFSLPQSQNMATGKIVRLRTAPAGSFDNTILGVMITLVGTASV